MVVLCYRNGESLCLPRKEGLLSLSCVGRCSPLSAVGGFLFSRNTHVMPSKLNENFPFLKVCYSPYDRPAPSWPLPGPNSILTIYCITLQKIKQCTGFILLKSALFISFTTEIIFRFPSLRSLILFFLTIKIFSDFFSRSTLLYRCFLHTPRIFYSISNFSIRKNNTCHFFVIDTLY